MLREYQIDLLNKLKLSIKQGHKKICVVAACGSGKSYIIKEIVDGARAKHSRVLVLCHRIELKNQLEDLLGIEVMLYQTATRHLNTIPTPDIIIVDESHLSLNKSYYKIFDYFPNAITIGFTATPVKNNLGGLGLVYDDLVIGVDTKWLIANHYLAPYEYYSFPLLERRELTKDNTGEYEMPVKHKLYGDVIGTYNKLAYGKKAIVFASSIAHSKELCDLFNANGIPAFHLDGNTPEKERTQAIKDFRDGTIKVLCNFLIVAEGLSVDDCDVCILCKPTSSLARYLQSAMRCMRYKEGKTAIIIDHCQNYLEHGMVDDDRGWSLAIKHRTRIDLDEKELVVRQCSKCYRVYEGSSQECPYCHHINAKPKKQIEMEQQAELERIKKVERRKQGMARTFEELVAIGKARGYSNPRGWAYYIMRSRNNDNI